MTLENCFLFSRNTNFNNMRTKNCNNIDKGINNKMIIPSNSRPLTNNTVTTNCSILSQPGQVQPEQVSSRFIRSRNPSDIRRNCNNNNIGMVFTGNRHFKH